MSDVVVWLETTGCNSCCRNDNSKFWCIVAWSGLMSEKIHLGEKHLRSVDPTLAELIPRYGPCSLMDSPRGHFHTLVWAIINQQLSVKAARTIERRVLDHLKTGDLQADHFHRVREQSLRGCGLSAAKVRYIRSLVSRVRSGQLKLEELDRLQDDEVAKILMDLPGIGRWTVDMLLMFSLGRMDVFPVGDLALRKSIRNHYRLDENVDIDVYHQIAEPWRPYRTIASWYYWAAVD